MEEQICRLCRSSADLRNSHIIPNALFRRIKQGNAGKMIAFDTSERGLVDQTITSWSERLLCAACEQRLSSIERYALGVLRKADRSQSRRDDGVLLAPLDYGQFKRFTTSLVWRAAESSLQPFAKIDLSAAARERIRVSLL